jgi:hypothetical protein
MTMSTSGTISRQIVERFMTASNQIFLVMDAGRPKAAFTTRHEMQAYLTRRLDTFCNPLVYYVLGQSRPVNHDHVVGAGGMKMSGRLVRAHLRSAPLTCGADRIARRPARCPADVRCRHARAQDKPTR